MPDNMSPDQTRALLRLGAAERLRQIQEEMAAIHAAFPDLAPSPRRRGRRPRSAAGAAKETVSRPAAKAPSTRKAARSKRPGRRRPMTPEERKAISERFKRYWAARRAEKAAAEAMAEKSAEAAPRRSRKRTAKA